MAARTWSSNLGWREGLNEALVRGMGYTPDRREPAGRVGENTGGGFVTPSLRVLLMIEGANPRSGTAENGRAMVAAI